MKGDLICVNGEVTREESLGVDALLGCNFVYQKIHTLEHRPLHVDLHLRLIETSYRTLYGSKSGLARPILEEEIARLLDTNRYPTGSNLVILYLFPNAEGMPQRLLSCQKQLLYKGYTLWHKNLKATIVPYEYPYPAHQTAVSLTANNYAQRYALRQGFDAALTENYAGILTGMGEYPLFEVHGREILTTPLENGVADSVERRLGIWACRHAGWALAEQPIESRQIGTFDELFAVVPQGVVSIRTCAGRLFPNTAARSIAEQMASLHLEKEDLLG